MKRIAKLAFLTIATVVMVGAALAQSIGVEAKVPFAFTVGDKVLPAGTYTIRARSSQLLMIRNIDQPATAISLFQENGKKSHNGGKLVFHRYAGQYFLDEILCDSAEMNVKLSSSKRERTAQMQEARLDTSSETLVAAR